MATHRKPEQDARGRFLPGNNGGPGRPNGSRNKLSEAFVADLYQDWQANGLAVIERVRTERPQNYLKVVASILPKDLNVRVDEYSEMSDEDLINRIRHLASVVGLIGAEEDGESIGDATGADDEETSRLN